MPSTTSSSVSSDFASSTVITPSLPTFCIALAIIWPISRSPLAAIEPTCEISSLVETFFERFLMSSTTASTALSMPRFRSIGFRPAATAFTPSRTIACARTVAVVVPSPARSLVFEATSRTIWAPMFSNLSASSISFATVTPSLVMRGAPKLLSSTTLRPFGPSVTLTASARMSMPRSMRWRASPLKRTSFAAIVQIPLGCSMVDDGAETIRRLLGGRGGTLEDSHDVALLHDQVLDTIELDLGAGPLAEQDAVAGLHVERHELAILIPGAWTNGDDLAFHRLFLGRVRNDDAALGLAFFLDSLDHDAVVKRTELHAVASIFSWLPTRPDGPRSLVSTLQYRVPKAHRI